MVIIGLILIALGALAILFAFAFTDPGTGGTYLGVDVNVLSAFLIGVAAGAAILTTPNVWFGCMWNATQGKGYALEGERLSAFQQTLASAQARRAG